MPQPKYALMRWLIYLAALVDAGTGGGRRRLTDFTNSAATCRTINIWHYQRRWSLGYAADGRFCRIFASGIFVPVKAMPRRVIKAFPAAEDKTFIPISAST